MMNTADQDSCVEVNMTTSSTDFLSVEIAFSNPKVSKK